MAKRKKKPTKIAAIGDAARRRAQQDAIRGALVRHDFVLARVAEDLGVSDKLIHVYARSCGMDLAAEVRRLRRI